MVGSNKASRSITAASVATMSTGGLIEDAGVI